MHSGHEGFRGGSWVLLEALGVLLGSSWGPLGGSWGPLGGVLGGPGASRRRLGSLLGASWGAPGTIFFEDEFLIVFLIDFDSEKGAQRGGFGEPKLVQNRSKNEDENRDEKKTLLGASWVDLGTFWGAIGRAKTMKFYWFYHYFLKIDVLEDKRHPRAISVRFWSKKGAKMAPKWLPKRIKNRSKNMMFFLINF